MSLDNPQEMSVLEEWEGIDANGNEVYNYPAMWADPRNKLLSSTAQLSDCSGDDFGWRKVYDPNLGVYYIDDKTPDASFSEDPRIQWKAEQETMLQDYLNTAYKDLKAKQEMCMIKQERLNLAKQEMNVNLEKLNKCRASLTDLNSDAILGVGGCANVKYDPEMLKIEVEMIRSRVKKLAVELSKMRSSLSMSQMGVEALTTVKEKVTDPENGKIDVEEAGEMMKGIKGMNISIRLGEQKKKELLMSVADLSQHFSTSNIKSQCSSPLLVPPFSFSDTASQTDLSGEHANQYGAVAKLKLSYDQNRSLMLDLQRQLVNIRNQLPQNMVQFDANRLKLVQEKDQLLRELKSQGHAECEERVKLLEEDLIREKRHFEDLVLDNQRLQLSQQQVEIEERLLELARTSTSLEMQIKNLSRSTNSISSGSSLGSLGSLSVSSRGSQNSVLPFDFYSMQDYNLDLQHVNLPDLHNKVERLFQDQNLLQHNSSSNSVFQQMDQQNFQHSLAYQPSFQMIADDYDSSSDREELSKMVPSFLPYPPVQEEIEDGDEGFGLGEEEEDKVITSNRLPPSYEDHQQKVNHIIHDQPQQLKYSYASDLGGMLQHNPIQSNNFSFQQQQNLLQQQQQAWQSQQRLLGVSRQVGFSHSSDAISYPQRHPQQRSMCQRASSSVDNYHKLLSKTTYPNSMSSISLPSLFNTSSLQPMTNFGSESQLFGCTLAESHPDGYPFTNVTFAPGEENDHNTAFELSDLVNSQLRVDHLPTVTKNLLTEFRVDNNYRLLQQQQHQHQQQQQQQQFILDQQQALLIQQRRQKICNDPCSECSQLSKASFLSASSDIQPVAQTFAHHIAPTTGSSSFAIKSRSTSQLHSAVEPSFKASCPVLVSSSTLSSNSFHKVNNNNNNNISSLSLCSSSLGEESSNLGSDSGVFELTNRLKNVLSAQILVQFKYDYSQQEILLCIEKARNLIALSVHDSNEIMFRVTLLPLTSECKPYNLGKTFHFPVESEKALSKTIQVYVLRRRDVTGLHQLQEEPLGMCLISLASFDLSKTISDWYNILSFQFMDPEINQPMMSQMTLNTEVKNSSNIISTPQTSTTEQAEDNKTNRITELKNLPEESSDESTVISSQTSTLTRGNELEEIHRITQMIAKFAPTNQSNDLYQLPLPKVDMADNDDPTVNDPTATCDKETNTDLQKSSCVPVAPLCLRRPIKLNPKFNREQPTGIRRWQTFSPAADVEADHNHKLNRSGSDSSVRRKKSFFDRQAIQRQSIRLKKSSVGLIKPPGRVESAKHRTSIDLVVDFHAHKTKLEALGKEICALQNIKRKLEEAKEKGDTEPSWLLEDEDLQALLQETSGTFRRKTNDRRRLSDIGDLTERKMRKVKMEILSLQARNCNNNNNEPLDKLMFKKKMAFFTVQDENLSFLDQTESEIDDIINKGTIVAGAVVDDKATFPNNSTVPSGRIGGLLSIKGTSNDEGNSERNQFESLVF